METKTETIALDSDARGPVVYVVSTFGDEAGHANIVVCQTQAQALRTAILRAGKLGCEAAETPFAIGFWKHPTYDLYVAVEGVTLESESETAPIH